MADRSRSGTLEGDEFVLFYKMLTQRDDVLRIFQQYSSDGQKLTLQDLEEFLCEEQLEGLGGKQRALELIERYEPSETGTMHFYSVYCVWEQRAETYNIIVISALYQ